MERTGLYYPITILMAVSAIFWPFWVTAIFFIVGVLLFENFYPGLMILFVMDAVYGFETFRVGPVYGFLTISGILLFIFMKIIKGSTSIINR